MNRLQSIATPGHALSPGRILVTMNPIQLPRFQKSSHMYSHPLITSESLAMSKELQQINGVDGVSFAGAWMGWGFHEDGFVSGKYVARCLIEGRENMEGLELAKIEGNLGRRVGLCERVLRRVVEVVQWALQQR